MPFTESRQLDPNPDVRILFSGLLILEPQPDGTCEVFVNSSAPRHHLTIEVRRKREGRPDELMMRHVGPLAFVTRDQPGEIPTHGMIIRKVEGQTAVRAFAPNEPQPEGAPDALSLAIDMKSDRLHRENRELGPDPQTETMRRLLDVDPLGGRPSILLNDGVFYTAAKTRDDVRIMLKRPDGEDQEMPKFASLIGAAITLDGESELAILWRNQGKLERLSLARKQGVTYEIYIVNDPLFESDAITDLARNPRHDEFAEYYKILHRVPSNEQFRLQVIPLEQNPERGSTRAPCMPVLNGGG
jgi:hypothetical protein